MSEKIAVVTGGNRGIGFETCRQLASKGFTVLLTARNNNEAQKASSKLRSDGYEIIHHELDVSNSESVQNLSDFFRSNFRKLDVLVNNAGVYHGGSPAKVSLNKIKESFDVNVVGPWILIQSLLPLLMKSKSGRIINVSSGAGQIETSYSSYSAYKISKLALNGLTKMFAEEYPKLSVNAVGPGWVRTRMGGSGAPIGVEEGVDTIVWLATMSNPPTGGFYKERKKESW